MKHLTTEQILDLEFKVRETPILSPFGGAFVVADPSLLTPDLSPDDRWHLFLHTTFGVYHFDSPDGISFNKVQKVEPTAMRPNINRVGNTYYLFYEKTRSLLANALTLANLAKWKSVLCVRSSTDLVHWSKPKAVVTSANGYEKSDRGSEDIA